MKHSIILIGLWCMVAFNAFPQHILTIDDCHKLALSNNYSLKISQNNVMAAKEEQHQAFTNYFPVVSATGVAFQADKGMAKLSVTPDMSLNMLKMAGQAALLPYNRYLQEDKLLMATVWQNSVWK